MNSLILTGFLAFFVVALVVGVRLLLLWRRTRQLPELLMGIGVLGIGPVGFGCMTIGAASISNPPIANAGFGIGTLAVAAGVLAKCIFNWRVYRRNSVAAMLATYGVGVLMATILTIHLIDGQWIPAEALAWDTFARSLAQVGCLLWGSAESLYYWSQMRRRLKLELADPVVVNRFLLWGIGAGFAGVGSGIGAAAEAFTGVPMLQIAWVVSTSSAFGFVAAVSIYLAFVPPERYLRLVRGYA
jgi:hypothetical protein